MKNTIIPLKLIATNLTNGHKKVFTAEDDIYIKDAVLATMAMPGIFDEHIIGTEVYGDGFYVRILVLTKQHTKIYLQSTY